MSGSERTLSAAQTSPDDPLQDEDSSNQGSGQQPNMPGRTKRTLIESACAACRRRKSRCDGVRPTCSRCQNLRTECVYEAEEGESRWSALRRRCGVLETERDDLRDVLSHIRNRPEQEALEIVNRLRNGGAYDELINMPRQSRDGGHPTHSHIGAGIVGEQRLPPIRTMVDMDAPTQAYTGPGSAQAPSHRRVPSDGSSEVSPTHALFRSST